MPHLTCSFLPGWAVLELTCTDEGIAVDAEYLMHPKACPECQGNLKHHGSLKRNYVDAPVRGKRVSLLVERRRYRCENGHTPQQPLDDCVDGRQMTIRALRYIEHESVRSPMGSIASRLGVSDKTVRDVCSVFFDRLSSSRIPIRVKRLELVRINIGGVQSILLIDREQGRFLDLVSLAEWQKASIQLLNSACYPELIESVYGPDYLLEQGGLNSVEQEILPTDPNILEAIRETTSASTRVGFTTARARVQLWSDPILHSQIVQRGFALQCDSCLASSLDVELKHIRIKMPGSGKTNWKEMRLCPACRELRTPLWFSESADFI
ncbi:transposase family protein [Sedimenticola sp.]|uniref:transposase family protein n=1 Tax=Sedimenticola sp. TaxID=1940285 RepID=UPI003D0CB44C